MPTYVKGSSLPNQPITWKVDGTLIDFSTGWTFSLKIGHPGSAATVTKSTGITGAATAPNVTIQWATSGELVNLAAGNYTAQLEATRDSDSRKEYMTFPLTVAEAIT